MKIVENKSKMTSLSLLASFSYIISKKLGSIAFYKKNFKWGLSYKGGPSATRPEQEGFLHTIFNESSKNQENSYPSPIIA